MDDGLLIEQVSRFPALYDKTDPRYKLKLEKENAWRTIGLILGFDHQICLQRWLVLRQRYVKIKRETRETPSGSGATPTLAWPYYDLMGFLDPFLTTRKTDSNFTPVRSSAPTRGLWDSMSYIMEEDDSTPSASSEPAPTEAATRFLPTPKRALTLASSSGTQKRRRITEEQSEAEGSNLEEESGPYTIDPEPLPSTTKRNTPSDSESDLSKIRQTLPIGKKKLTQEMVFEKMGSCFDVFKQKMTEKKEDEDMSFAISLAKDMSILTPAEKICFKKKMYEVLEDILSKRE